MSRRFFTSYASCEKPSLGCTTVLIQTNANRWDASACTVCYSVTASSFSFAAAAPRGLKVGSALQGWDGIILDVNYCSVVFGGQDSPCPGRVQLTE